MADGLVETGQGSVQGLRDGRVWCWRGIPYARPPVGPLRFRKPKAPAPWAGVRDGSRFGAPSLQAVGGFGGRREPPPGEDCLYLNIWSPAADERKRPVMVWVHGGGFVSGSGGLYRGAPLAALGDIVVVTVNYRLGVLGFVNLGDAASDSRLEGNLGLHDVLAALAWVRAEIERFGGDPDQVTLAGESAGSIMVSLLMLPGPGLSFQRAIMQSGTWSLIHSRERSRQVSEAYLEHLGGARTLERLQSLPAATLLEAQQAVGRKLKGISPAAPWYDGDLLPESYAAAVAKPPPPIPLLAGATRDEIVLFRVLPGPKILQMRRGPLFQLIDRDLPSATAQKLRRAYPDTREGNRALGSDLNFVMPTLHFAERHAVAGGPTWLYRFDYAHPLLRACHALELFFLWPFPGLLGAMIRGGFLTGLRSGLSERMRAAWTSFVRTGSPGDDWPAFTPPERRTRLFALQDRTVADPMRDRREAWDGQDVAAGK